MFMPTISITDARKNLFELADKSKEAASPILVVNSRGSNFVVISEDDWNDIQETLALASVPGLLHQNEECPNLEKGSDF
jgi:antitoxin YefM